MSNPVTKTLENLQATFNLPEHDLQRAVELVKEKERREREALRLYEPLEWQKAFHESKARERVAIAANQDGKSLCAYAELVRIVTGEHPDFPKQDGVAVIVGYDEKFIGLNPYRYLFKKGAFKIIRNADGKWEAWKPWIPDHKARKAEAIDAPPLLPKRFIKSVSWLKKKDHIFSKIELKNGWTILAFGSKGDEVPGFQADFVLFDEDIDNPAWYDEMVGRCTIRNGRIVWAALPKAENNALITLVQRADRQLERPVEERTTEKFRPTTRNPYIDEETWKANAERWMDTSEDTFRVRALGEVNFDGWLMYPGFDPRRLHNACLPDASAHNALQKALAPTNGVPPKDWCRYMILDPGHSVCAVLFMAVAPPSVGDFKVAYDLLYMKNCDAEAFGNAVEPRVAGWNFEEFIIDAHGGRITEIGSGITPREHYENQLKRRNIVSNKTGSRFRDGVDDIDGRVECLRSWMRVRPDGTPTLYVVPKACDKLNWELSIFKKLADPKTKQPTDRGNRKANTHALECLEYAAAHGLPYVRPKDHWQKTWQDVWRERLLALNKRTAAAAGRGDQIFLGATGV